MAGRPMRLRDPERGAVVCPFCREGKHNLHDRRNAPQYAVGVPEVSDGYCYAVASTTDTAGKPIRYRCACEHKVGAN